MFLLMTTNIYVKKSMPALGNLEEETIILTLFRKLVLSKANDRYTNRKRGKAKEERN